MVIRRANREIIASQTTENEGWIRLSTHERMPRTSEVCRVKLLEESFLVQPYTEENKAFTILFRRPDLIESSLIRHARDVENGIPFDKRLPKIRVEKIAKVRRRSFDLLFLSVIAFFLFIIIYALTSHPDNPDTVLGVLLCLIGIFIMILVKYQLIKTRDY
ncbi:hypothetical protein [Persicobacter diffluens]